MFTDFEKKVFGLLKKIPAGKVTTYKEMARALDRPQACRAVGNAVHKNPDAPQVPCHRVVRSDGGLGGYAEGPEKKAKLLAGEGVRIRNGRVEDFEDLLFRFN